MITKTKWNPCPERNNKIVSIERHFSATVRPSQDPGHLLTWPVIGSINPVSPFLRSFSYTGDKLEAIRTERLLLLALLQSHIKSSYLCAAVCRQAHCLSLRTIQDADDLEHHLACASAGGRIVPRSGEVVHGSSKRILERLPDGRQVALDRFILDRIEWTSRESVSLNATTASREESCLP